MPSPWKKVWSITLAIVLISVLFLAACSNNAGTKDEQGSSEKPATAEGGSNDDKKADDALAKYRPVEGKTYEISWSPYIIDPVPDDAPLKKHYEEKFNVKFKLLNLDNKNITELLNLKFAAGEIPDFMSDGVKRENLQQYVKQGVLMELPEEVIKEFAPDLYEKALAYEPKWLKFAMVDGKIYGLPEMVNSGKRTVTVWRGDWLKKVGITKTPDTLEEFEEAFYKFANEDPDGNGKKDTYGLSISGLAGVFGAFGYLPGYSSFDWQDWFWHERDGKIVNGAVQPEMKDALALIHKWYKDGVLDPEFITGENMGGYWALSHSFINGRIGYSGHGHFYHWNERLKDGGIGANYEEIEKLDPKVAESLVHSLPPEGPGGRNLYTDNKVPGKIIAFGRNLEKEPDKLGKILEILNHTSASSIENNLTATLGFKGEMWDVDPETGLNKPIGKWAELSDRVDGKMIFQNQFGVFPAEGPRMDWAKEHNYDVMTRNKLQVALPSESMYKAELIKLRDEAYISIITGDKPIDYFEEFVEKWHQMGGEQLTKEANEWYQEFNN
ncbi:extracellular solute-binding protein [Paenibacillus alkalitolerans]|uniref:extracellular solute-binding protein n=1 Tax=Paenibacillus alkalitolerans TaxID=2799335 RepID=UPI0018F7372C|nr:extracellular solute-binding protein [Paenibacillus alkalitolerans]